MKKIALLFLCVFLAVGAMATDSFAASAYDEVPGQCFVNYASWAGPYCTIYIVCFVLQQCATPPPIVEPQSVTPIDAAPPRNAKSLEPGDADGVSG